jgi:hypothetical protein
MKNILAVGNINLFCGIQGYVPDDQAYFKPSEKYLAFFQFARSNINVSMRVSSETMK